MLTEQDIEKEINKPITYDELVASVPRHLRNKIPPKLLDTINNISTDAYFTKTYKENFISYIKVLSEGNFNIYDYVNAIKYVSFKLMGNTNKASWIKVFPDRYATLMSKGADEKEVSANYTSYNKGKLVNLILEQAMIPIWLLNQPKEQEAINVLADLMINANSELVRMKSADSLLTHIKKPETHKIDLNIGVKQSGEVEDMMAKLSEIAQKQQQLIAGGMITKEVIQMPLLEQPIIDVEVD